MPLSPCFSNNIVNLHFILGFVETISQSSSCGLIDYTKDIQTSNLTSIFGSLKFNKTQIPLITQIEL